MRKFTDFFKIKIPRIDFKKLFYKVHRWRYKHITQKQFINILSVIIGLLSGLAAVLIKNLTHIIQYFLESNFIHDIKHAFYFLFPIIGILIVVLIIYYIIKKPVEEGIPAVLYAITKLKGLIPPYQAWASLITAPITVGFGGSVGLEGPTVITGSALSSNFSRLLHLSRKERILMIGAAAAGSMAAIFKAPLAGIMFAVEIFSLDLTMTSLIPLILASVFAILTSFFFMGKNILLHFTLKDGFVLNDIPFFFLLGISSALTSIYFVKAYQWITGYFSRYKNPFKKWFIAGILLGLIIYLFPNLYGEGYEVINHVIINNYHYVVNHSSFHFNHNETYMVILLFVLLVTFKVIAMSLTFSAGGVGGVFAPTLFTGSLSGYVFALLVNYLNLFGIQISYENFALAGMAGAMAGILQAPLTAVFLIVEITGGYDLIVPIMLVSAVSYIISKSVLKYNIYAKDLAKINALPTHDKDKYAGMLIEWKEVIEKNFSPVSPDMSLGDLVHKVIEKANRDIFPVLDENGQFLGEISLNDLRTIMFHQEYYDKIFVKDLYHKAPAVIFIYKDHFPDIMRKFQETAAWNLPVVDDNYKYIGFISKSKLLSVYRKKLLVLTSE